MDAMPGMGGETVCKLGLPLAGASNCWDIQMLDNSGSSRCATSLARDGTARAGASHHRYFDISLAAEFGPLMHQAPSASH